MSEDRQVRAVHVWEDIRTEHGLALSRTYQHIDDRGAAITFHHATVLILEGRNPHRASSFNHGRSDRVGILCGLDKNEPSCSAVFWVGRPVPILDTAIDFQN